MSLKQARLEKLERALGSAGDGSCRCGLVILRVEDERGDDPPAVCPRCGGGAPLILQVIEEVVDGPASEGAPQTAPNQECLPAD